MDCITKNHLTAIRLGEPEVMDKLAVFPLFFPDVSKLDYNTFQDAFEAGGKIKVTEVNEHGSVPELKVIITSAVPVLLLDGEELLGAKQNRVLNTSILLKELSETIIPVSCTEQGRWSYQSDCFHPGEAFLATPIRARKHRSVGENLGAGQRYRSDQGMVWNEISDLSARHGVRSDTGAYHDAAQAKIKDMDQYIKSLPCHTGQTGMMVFINGKIAGMDLFGRAEIYQKTHAKLIRSYAMDIPVSNNDNPTPSKHDAQSFINSVINCPEKAYESVGYGTDYRCHSGGIVGSSLVHREEVIHSSFFNLNDQPENNMAGFNRRRNLRI